MSMLFKIYTKLGCKFCVKAKEFLNEKQFTFQEIEPDKETVEKLKQDTNHFTYPYIFWNDEFIGGYQELIFAYDSLKFGNEPDF